MADKKLSDPTLRKDADGNKVSSLEYSNGRLCFVETGEPCVVKGGKVFSADGKRQLWPAQAE